MSRIVRLTGGIFVLAMGIATLAHFYAFKWSRPSFPPRFFTTDLAAKYATPEAAFEYFDAALLNRDAALYEEVLGRPMTPTEQQKFSSASFPSVRSVVVRRDKKKDIAYLVTDRNAGEFFEFVGGRWVFTPEDGAANLRIFFRSFGL